MGQVDARALRGGSWNNNQDNLRSDARNRNNPNNNWNRRKGLPIGNLTSQIFANFFLSPFDHFIKEVLRCPAYLRYVDDCVLFADTKRILWQWFERIIIFLQCYRLRLNLTHCDVYPSETGRCFLGQVVFKSTRRLPGVNVRAFRRRFRRWHKNPPDNMRQRIASWLGHAGQANTKALMSQSWCIGVKANFDECV